MVGAPSDLAELGKRWQAGAEVDWAAFHARERYRRVPLPGYTFERKRYWIDGRKPQNVVSFTARAGGDLPRESDLDRWFYRRVWKDVPRISPSTGNAMVRKTYLIFEDSCGLTEQLSRRLTQEGHDVVRVRCFEHLLSNLQRRGGDSLTILHCVGFSAPALEPWQLDEAWLDRGVHSVIRLVQALQKYPVGPGMSLRIVANEVFDVPGGQAVRPEKSMLGSLTRVIRQELQGLHCQCIDLADRDVGAAVAALCEELRHAAESELIVLDRGRRLRPSYDHVLLPQSVSVPAILRSRGTYLLTGGLGGVALTIAKWLAERVQANLVLISRTQSTEGNDWPSRVAQIEAAGGTVEIISADVADSAQLRDAIRRAKARFSTIDGVIHAAGIASEEMIARKTRERVIEVIRPKVHGTYVLAQALREEQLDFFLMCSSISSITGGVGQSDYSAANAFQNAFAALHAGQHTRYISICWDTWSQSGMAANTRVSAHLQSAKERELSYGLSDREALQVLARILVAAGLHQVIVSTRDLQARLDPSSDQGASES